VGFFALLENTIFVLCTSLYFDFLDFQSLYFFRTSGDTMKHVSYVPLLAALTLLVSLVGAKFYSPPQYNHYKAGPIQHHHHPGKPTSRHK